MTQTESPRGQPHRHLAIFGVAFVALLVLLGLSWHAATARIAALETRLQRLADTQDQGLPDGDWREELERLAKRLEDRVDARVAALAANGALPLSTPEERRPRVAAVAPAARESTASEWASDPATESVLEFGFEEEEHFEKIFQAMRDSLGLEEERWAEVAVDLEQILESLWPEYVTHLRSKNTDTADLKRRYCARIERVLAPEEASRLDCGGPGAVTDLVQPPEGGATP